MQMRRCSIRLTTFADAFLGFTKSCEDRACLKGAGVLTRTKTCLPARRKRSIACANYILTCRMTNSSTRILPSGCANEFWWLSPAIRINAFERKVARYIVQYLGRLNCAD